MIATPEALVVHRRLNSPSSTVRPPRQPDRSRPSARRSSIGSEWPACSHACRWCKPGPANSGRGRRCPYWIAVDYDAVKKFPHRDGSGRSASPPV